MVRDMIDGWHAIKDAIPLQISSDCTYPAAFEKLPEDVQTAIKATGVNVDQSVIIGVKGWLNEVQITDALRKHGITFHNDLLKNSNNNATYVVIDTTQPDFDKHLQEARQDAIKKYIDDQGNELLYKMGLQLDQYGAPPESLATGLKAMIEKITQFGIDNNLPGFDESKRAGRIGKKILWPPAQTPREH